MDNKDAGKAVRLSLRGREDTNFSKVNNKENLREHSLIHIAAVRTWVLTAALFLWWKGEE